MEFFRIRTCLVTLSSLVLSCFIVFGSDYALASCQEYVGSCEFYICLNQYLGCGANSYMRRFGYPYCQQFATHEFEFDGPGQQFSQSVRVCLQKEMEQDLDQLSCDSARDLALKHHIECYHQAGFCQLPLFDKKVILNTAWKEFFRFDFFRTAIQMNLKCLPHK